MTSPAAGQLSLVNEEDDGGAEGFIEAPQYHSMLEVWQATLEPIEREQHKAPTLDWTGMLIRNWNHILQGFSSVAAVQKHYFRIMKDAQRVLDFVVEKNPKALLVDSKEEDVETNGELYTHLLTEWQKVLLVEQHNWSVDHPEAEAIFVALGEVQLQLLGQEGMAAWLGAIGLTFSDEVQEAHEKEISDFRESLEE